MVAEEPQFSGPCSRAAHQGGLPSHGESEGWNAVMEHWNQETGAMADLPFQPFNFTFGAVCWEDLKKTPTAASLISNYMH